MYTHRSISPLVNDTKVRFSIHLASTTLVTAGCRFASSQQWLRRWKPSAMARK